MKTSTRKTPASKAAPIPDNETERLSALNRYCILDTPPETGFDELTELAAIICKAPVATITLIDQDREWYKSRVGISDEEAPRDISFCAHTILGKDLFIIPDTFKDERFRDNPLVKDDPPLRFYAAAPLITDEGYALGTLCVIDHVPRQLNSDQKKALKTLARQAMAQIELRLKNTELKENLSKCKEADAVIKINRQLKAEIETKKQVEKALKASRAKLAMALESVRAGIWDWDMINDEIIWNKEHEVLFGFEPGSFNGSYEQFENRIHPDDKARLDKTLKDSIKNKTKFHHEYRIIRPDKSIHWIEGNGQFEFDETGRPVRMFGITRDITDRKDAEEELLFTRFAIDHAADCIYLINPEGKFVYVNDAVCKTFGFSRDELLAMHVYDVDPLYDQSTWQNSWGKIKTDGHLHVVSKHRTKDGRIVDIDVHANYFRFKGREFNCAIVRDISERKLVQNRLHEEQRKLSTLVSNLPGMVYRCKNDPDWTLEYGSAYMQRLTGYPLNDFYTGRIHWGRIIHPEDTRIVWNKVQDAVSMHSPYEIEYRIRGADGSDKWVWEQGRGVFDQEDRLKALEGVIFEITDWKLTDQALRESEEKFYKAFHSNPNSMIINRLNDGRIIDANKAFERIVGYSRDEAIGKTPIELSIWIQPRERDRYTQILKEKGSVRDFEVQVRRKDGETRIHRLSAETITLHNEPCIVSIGEDITEKKQTREKLLFTQFAVDHAADSIHWLTSDGSLIYVNDTACKKLGYSREELMSMTILDINPDYTKQVWSERWQTIKARKHLFYETRHRTKDGRIIPVEVRGNYLKYKGREYDCSIVRDISERKKVESSLYEMNLALTHAMPGISRLDTSGCYQTVNKTYANMLGYEPEELIGTNWYPTVLADDRAQALEAYKQTIEVGKGEFEVRAVRKDGSEFFKHVLMVRITNDEGEIIGHHCFMRDISERKQAEYALRRNEIMLQEAQQVAHMGSWEVDHKLRRLIWSDECYRIFEVDKETFHVSYESFLESVHPDDRKQVDAAFREAVKKHSIYNINHRLLMPDGRIKYINEKCRTYYDENGRPLRSVGTTIDYTREKLAEIELKAKARQQQFIARLGRLSLSKTDLTEIFDTAITGLAEILDVDYSKILELQPDGKQFVMIAGHGWRTGMVGQTVVSTDLDSQAGYTLNQNKPVVVKDLRTESRFSGPQLLLEQGIVSGVSVVIEGRDKPYGVLGVHTRSQRKFSQFDVDFVQAVAVILAEAIEHDFVSDQILSSRQRLRNLAARLQVVREEERTRISREIHDELGQSLTGLRIDLAWIHNQLEGKDVDLSERVQSALGLADSTLDSVRHISHDLRPPILDDLGLEAAIEWQVGEFCRYSHCQCDLEINAGDIGIQNERDTVVFRILQEALTNIARHANADKIEVKLLNLNRRLILKIVDNGVGINKAAIDSNDSIGLIGMRERAGTLGGRVDIQRGDNGGTIIRLVVPLGKSGRFDS